MKRQCTPRTQTDAHGNLEVVIPVSTATQREIDRVAEILDVSPGYLALWWFQQIHVEDMEDVALNSWDFETKAACLAAIKRAGWRYYVPVEFEGGAWQMKCSEELREAGLAKSLAA